MRCLAPLALLALWPALAAAQGPTSTCVEVRTARGDADALKRLVMTELDRFPTHRATEGDCGSYLRVEVIEVAEATYVTGRINTQVPHREAVEEGDLAHAIERMLRVVLHNDPVRLRGPRSGDWLRDAFRALKRGETFYGAEAYEVATWLDGGPTALGGVAVQLRREAYDWHLGARLAFAHQFSDTPADEVHLTSHLAIQLEAIWFPNPLADSAFYVGGVLGAEHQRFHGPAPGYGEGVAEDYNQTGLSVGARAGFELFRTTTGRLDLFAQAMLPAFLTSDDEGKVVDAWLPTLSVGAGMLF
ncbi:MAG: hypothetical protein KC620_22065 [Myxococcales bacterium]|nr:hypothetical protein [Myxococcales bacterium]